MQNYGVFSKGLDSSRNVKILRNNTTSLKNIMGLDTTLCHVQFKLRSNIFAAVTSGLLTIVEMG